MDIFSIITLLGGLGLFLYGMNLMGAGLKASAGGKLESVLEKMSSTPLRGIFFGTLVTGVIQSSSATAVMVVGFVNSGIMKLTQAIGVVMGANIGTTVTGWLLSLAEISESALWLKLIKPTTLAPLIVLVGAALVMFAKSNKKRNIGSVALGFGLLMMGMSLMSSAAEPLADDKSFCSLLTLFSNPFLGLIVGMLMTAVVQSSSASIGILQALALTGTVSYATAIPIILGMDIGASMPVLISSIGTSKNAKCVALTYLYYNVIGSAVFFILFYGINAFAQFAFLPLAATPVGIAIFNSLFKVFATALIAPFIKQLEKLVRLSVPEPKKSAAPGHAPASELLDERFLRSPGYALTRCKSVVDIMADIDVESVQKSIAMMTKFSDADAELIENSESTVDEYEDRLGTYLVKLSALALSESESYEVSKLLHTIGDYERISDHSLNLLDAAREIRAKGIAFSPAAAKELGVISRAIMDILTTTHDAFSKNDIALAERVEPLEEVIDELCAELKNRHVDRLTRGVCTINTGFVFNDVLNNYERISDHCSNIAVCVIRTSNKIAAPHELTKTIKTTDNARYKELYEGFMKEYVEAL